MPASTKDIHAFSATLTLEERPAPVVSEIALAAANPVFRFPHIPELDGFRGVAIQLVIFGHYGKFHGANAEMHELARTVAEFGVLLFFVLSGFMMTAPLCRERSATGGVDFKQFYLRRVLRLAPALLLFLLTVGL